MRFCPTVTTKFEVVKYHGTKSVPCKCCGKRLQRKKTHEATINPWNKNADGSVKTRNEVQADLIEKDKEWRKQPETCKDCKTAPKRST